MQPRHKLQRVRHQEGNESTNSYLRPSPLWRIFPRSRDLQPGSVWQYLLSQLQWHHLLIPFYYRWSPENKEIIDDYTYLPFGKGPRGCMGFRFAIEQMKLAICTLIQKFEFFPAEETLVIVISGGCNNLFPYSNISIVQEKMQFRNGFLPILIPTNTTVGVRLR